MQLSPAGLFKHKYGWHKYVWPFREQNSFRKKLRHRCLTVFWIRLCKLSVSRLEPKFCFKVRKSVFNFFSLDVKFLSIYALVNLFISILSSLYYFEPHFAIYFDIIILFNFFIFLLFCQAGPNREYFATSNSNRFLKVLQQNNFLLRFQEKG